ncbi:hypothetical protein ACRYCC_27435 [Actinomadura scrupuli]|uniref:hypothetical protein n=1 Tax=Actinomadura scrupuli TaxID=559629 RepID=UPI003D985D32
MTGVGLPWTDVELESGVARIRETRPDGDLDPDDPKSEYGDRSVTLDAITILALLAWRDKQEEDRPSPHWPRPPPTRPPRWSLAGLDPHWTPQSRTAAPSMI